MSSTFGNHLKISLFGESHGECIGATIHGLAPGIKINHDFIKAQLELRKAKDNISTARQEEDKYRIISGEFNGYTTGTPLMIIIENTNIRSSDYKMEGFRPGHADYSGHVKYLGYQDYRGGGHFSGRLTAPLVAIGAILIDILKNKNIKIGTHIQSIHHLEDDMADLNNLETLMNQYNHSYFPLNNQDLEPKMRQMILDAKKEKDSVGGILQSFVINLPAGIGEPFFDSIESKIAHALFSIPGVKGVEFGRGFAIAGLKGSEANDCFYAANQKVTTLTNHNGGINGGISNGMPLIIRTAIKPTPSIAKLQQTINQNLENIEIEVNGRHDPAIIVRARVVVDSLIAFSLLDLIVERHGYLWMK